MYAMPAPERMEARKSPSSLSLDAPLLEKTEALNEGEQPADLELEQDTISELEETTPEFDCHSVLW